MIRRLAPLLIVICILIMPAFGGSVSVDTYQSYNVRSSPNTQTWTSARADTTGELIDIYPAIQIVADYSASNYYLFIKRGIVSFDTDGIIQGYEHISNATLCLKVTPTGKYAHYWDPFFLTIVEASPGNVNTPSGNDYAISHFNTDEAIYQISSDLFTNGQWTNFTIPTSSIVTDGYTIFGFMMEKDYSDTVPVWSSDKSNSLTFEDVVLVLEWDITTPTPTQTPYPGNISVNLIEKYSNAALVSQAITLTPTTGGAGQTKTSLYGETLHFGVVPGMEYWFNASRAGYQDYNETYTIPSSPGIYNVYMERILPPIANHSYAHFSVVDQTNGGLIPNAEIRLSDGQTKLTNSAGYAWFSVNNSEQINYYVSKPSGYWPAYGAMNLTADESILVALQRHTGPTATATMPGWTPVTVPTTGTGSGPVVTLSAQLREQNVQEGMDVWYTNLPFISQFLFLLFIIGGLGLMAGGTRRN